VVARASLAAVQPIAPVLARAVKPRAAPAQAVLAPALEPVVESVVEQALVSVRDFPDESAVRAGELEPELAAGQHSSARAILAAVVAAAQALSAEGALSFESHCALPVEAARVEFVPPRCRCHCYYHCR
jgi:hypothetical protein